MRIDKYIWSVRIYKTRTIARKSCSEGKVLLNNDPVKAGKSLKKKNIISIKQVPIWRTFEVIDFPKSRVGAALLVDYVKEITNKKDLEKLYQYELILKQNKKTGIKGRPTKKERRRLNKIIR